MGRGMGTSEVLMAKGGKCRGLEEVQIAPTLLIQLVTTSLLRIDNWPKKLERSPTTIESLKLRCTLYR